MDLQLVLNMKWITLAKSMSKLSIRVPLAVPLGILLTAATLVAQFDSAEVLGTVRDKTGGALVGAAAVRTEILLLEDDDASRTGRETVTDGGVAAQPGTVSGEVAGGERRVLHPIHRNEGDIVLLVERDGV